MSANRRTWLTAALASGGALALGHQGQQAGGFRPHRPGGRLGGPAVGRTPGPAAHARSLAQEGERQVGQGRLVGGRKLIPPRPGDQGGQELEAKVLGFQGAAGGGEGGADGGGVAGVARLELRWMGGEEGREGG